MVKIRKRKIGGKHYFYLEHSTRVGRKVEKKEVYLGERLPKNLEKIKADFITGIYKERWYRLLDDVKKGYSKEIKTMPKSVVESEIKKFSIRFTYDSQKIEGSKLTLRETADLIENKISPKQKSLIDIKEAESHQTVFNEMLQYKKDMSLQVTLYWHKRLFEATKPEIAGKIRNHQIMISGSKFVPAFPAEIYPLLQEFSRWYSKNKIKIHPVELSALVHLKFVTIHPFADGNGRISRLMMNFVLNKFGFPMFNIPYENRSSYYNALERAQVKRDDTIFIKWFIKRYVKENKKYLRK